jgi:hypothetical protein
MDIEVVKPNEFFLGKSFRSKHPNFKKLLLAQADKHIIEDDMIPPKGGKGNAYRYTKSGYRKDIRIKR